MEMKVKLYESSLQRTSAETIASVDDLLIQILLRLPIISLIRFKSVSKHWLSLITSCKFCHLRNPLPSPATGLFFYSTTFDRDSLWLQYIPLTVDERINPPLTSLDIVEDPFGLKILQSCNGLFLCCMFQARKRYSIYNPTTNQMSMVPNPDSGTGFSNGIRAMNLAFDPSKSDHYRVVCIQGPEMISGHPYHQIGIYSSKTRSWTIYGEPFKGGLNFDNGVYWNGAVHWIGSRTCDSLYFKTDKYKLHKMPMPPIRDHWDWESNYYFGESCDHLHFIATWGWEIQFDVYELKRDYSDWSVKYRFDLSEFVLANPHMIWTYVTTIVRYYYSFYVFALVRGKEDEGSFLVLRIPGRVIRYNLVDQNLVELHYFLGSVVEGELDPESEFEGSLKVRGANGFQFIESLYSV